MLIFLLMGMINCFIQLLKDKKVKIKNCSFFHETFSFIFNPVHIFLQIFTKDLNLWENQGDLFPKWLNNASKKPLLIFIKIIESFKKKVLANL